MLIHKEGYKIVGTTLLILAAVNLIAYFLGGAIALYIALVPTVLLALFVGHFFRVPKRATLSNPNVVYAPADGTVCAIEEVEETEFLGTKCIQVSIFMSVWNVHINWFPIKGKPIYYKYHPGAFLVAWHPKSSTLNERTSLAMETEKGTKIMMRQIAGALARRIVNYAGDLKPLEQNQEVGFIKFGSRVDLFLPLDAKIKVSMDQKTTGTQTIIAELE
ncbi:MAG TPA: phosphatidylserine decarboxylase family protein [Tenuifilaceae bacterium]|mgnify:CR=1 FL=1|nr:phosphatidylserine decarboxylase family protein [Tenuifilaceae bacterium]HQB78030.1 phosphatidylserine decarboxylase family protein [Tenuifilaceae bacterium]